MIRFVSKRGSDKPVEVRVPLFSVRFCGKDASGEITLDCFEDSPQPPPPQLPVEENGSASSALATATAAATAAAAAAAVADLTAETAPVEEVRRERRRRSEWSTMRGFVVTAVRG